MNEKKSPVNKTDKKFDVERLEQRVMYSASQYGGATPIVADPADALEYVDSENLDHVAQQADSLHEDDPGKNLLDDFDSDVDQQRLDDHDNSEKLVKDPVHKDTAVFTGNSQSYEFRNLGNGKIEVVAEHGSDIVSNVNSFQFDDGTYLTDELLNSQDWTQKHAESEHHVSEDSLQSGSRHNDEMFGDENNDRLIARGGDDFVHGGNGDDYIAGRSGDDTLNGGSGDDLIRAGSGNDLIHDGAGDDRVFGGSGQDVLTYSGNFDDFEIVEISRDKFEITGPNGTDTIHSVEQIRFHDRVVDLKTDWQSERPAWDEPTEQVAAFEGLQKSDLIRRNEGPNLQVGDAQANELRGTEVKDDISGAGGNDRIFGFGGKDFLRGNEGDDVLNGGANDDLVVGGTESDVLRGGAGNDKIAGQAGNDILLGDQGNDRIAGGNGSDRIAGGEGNDRLKGENGNDKISGGVGDDLLIGGRGKDLLKGGEGADKLAGQSGDDNLFGQAGDDRLVGNEGNDFVSGGDGNDFLKGNQGNDRIEGNSGDDILVGGEGDDRIIGGSGHDVAIFDGNFDETVITDLGNGNIRISGPDGVDIVSSVESLKFEDRRVETADLIASDTTSSKVSFARASISNPQDSSTQSPSVTDETIESVAKELDYCGNEESANSVTPNQPIDHATMTENENVLEAAPVTKPDANSTTFDLSHLGIDGQEIIVNVVQGNAQIGHQHVTSIQSEHIVGSAGNDIYNIDGARNGDTFNINAGRGFNQLDLSKVIPEHVDIQHGKLTVDQPEIRDDQGRVQIPEARYDVHFNNINTIRFADETVVHAALHHGDDLKNFSLEASPQDDVPYALKESKNQQVADNRVHGSRHDQNDVANRYKS